jgi:hypothetical protein
MDSLHAALLKSDETDFVSSLLDQLDMRRIPPSLEMHGQYEEDWDVALSALWNLLRIFECLFIDPKNPAVVHVRLKFGGLVVERWSDVVHWLVYLLLVFSKHPDETTLPFFCTAALKMLVDTEERDEWQEEVLHRPQTADLIHALLCQTEPQEGSYHYISDTDGCAVLSLLWNGGGGQQHFFPALTQLSMVRPRTRDKVIASLVLRARHIAEIATGKRQGLGPEFVEEESLDERLLCAGRSLRTLTVLASHLTADPTLLRIFLKNDIIFEYASAFSALAKGVHTHHMEACGDAKVTPNAGPHEVGSPQAIWRIIAETISGSFTTILIERTRGSNSAVPVAITGGLLHTILQCLIHLLPESREVDAVINKALPMVLLSLQTKKAVYSLSTEDPSHFSSDSGEDELSALMDLAQTRSAVAAQACGRVRAAMEDGNNRVKGALWAMAGMCSNHEVRRCANI